MAELRSAGRRTLVLGLARAVGLAPFALSLLEGTARAAPPPDERDLAILDAALTLEHHAIALYTHALGHGLVPAQLRERAVEFRGDHLGHRDTQVALIEERGGRPPAARADYRFPRLGPGPDTLRALLEIETAALSAYRALAGSIRSDDYLLTAGFILVDEVRHEVAWRRVLGYRIY